MKLARTLLCGVVVLGLTAGLAMAQEKAEKKVAEKKTGPQKGIMDTLAGMEKYTTLVELVKVAGAAESLRGTGIMVFAPTNEAFAALPKEKLEALKKDPAELKKVLLNHVSANGLGPVQLAKAEKVMTLGGMELTVKVVENITTVNGAKVGERIAASNGRIYPIDKVILPEAGEKK